MKRGFLASVIILLLVVLGLAACAPQPSPTPTPAPVATPKAKVVATPVAVSPKAAWEEKWDGVVAAGKREGRVVVYRTVGMEATMRIALAEAMKKHGINLEVVSGRGAELSAKILAERRAGIYSVDVYMGGTTTPTNELKPAGVFDPMEPALILPEVTDPAVWWGGKGVLWVDKDRLILASGAYPQASLTLNTNLVKPGEVKAYRDLLDPKWKGKIVMNDPTVAGAGQKWFSVLGMQILNWDFMRSLAKQEPAIVRDQRQQVEWLAHGKHAIGLAAEPMIVLEFVKAGASLLQLNAEEGVGLVTGPGSIALINRAPNPNAARVFINWFLSREGQTVYSRAMGAQSARLDVPTEGIPAARIRDPQAKYFWAEREEFLVKEAAEGRKMAVEIFGPLIR